jgi:predicted nucleic acid-binding protein
VEEKQEEFLKESMTESVVVDTNILFAALRSPYSELRERLLNDRCNFICPNFVIIELFKHKERLTKRSKIGEEETLCLEFGAKLWTRDEVLKSGLKKKGFADFYE